jgi:ankyrin repeat protein
MDNQDQLNSELLNASNSRNLIKIKELVKQGADINTNDSYILNINSQAGNLEVVKYVIKLVGINNHPKYILKWTSYQGHLEVVKYLVEKGFDIYAPNDDVLKFSAKRGHLDIVRFLIFDCNMNIKSKTLKYLQRYKLMDTLSIINVRDLQKELNANLINTNSSKSSKVKKI